MSTLGIGLGLQRAGDSVMQAFAQYLTSREAEERRKQDQAQFAASQAQNQKRIDIDMTNLLMRQAQDATSPFAVSGEMAAAAGRMGVGGIENGMMNPIYTRQDQRADRAEQFDRDKFKYTQGVDERNYNYQVGRDKTNDLYRAGRDKAEDNFRNRSLGLQAEGNRLARERQAFEKNQALLNNEQATREFRARVENYASNIAENEVTNKYRADMEAIKAFYSGDTMSANGLTQDQVTQKVAEIRDAYTAAQQRAYNSIMGVTPQMSDWLPDLSKTLNYPTPRPAAPTAKGPVKPPAQGQSGLFGTTR